MRILIGLTRSDTFVGGAFTHVRQIGHAFREKGADVIYVLGGDGVAADKLRSDGFQVKALPMLGREIRPLADALVLLQLVWNILKLRPALCSWHTAKIGALGRLASWLTRRRSYYVAHGVPFVEMAENPGHRLYERLERFLARLPSTIICVCRFDFEQYLRIGVRREKLMLIPNGMRGKLAQGSVPTQEEKVVRFITAARFEAQKDFETLGKACRMLAAGDARFQLDIYGDGSLESQVKAMMEGVPVDRVRFCGVVDDFAARLAQSDVFVLSSHWEGLPRSIIEAMACGKPVIASSVGGVSELVQHGQSGYLIPHADAEAFAAAMQAYIREPGLAETHGRAGKAYYEQNYTLDLMLRRYCNEYLRAA